MGWGALAAGVISAGASIYSSNKAAKGAAYRPWDSSLMGLGSARYERDGQITMIGDPRYQQINNLMHQGGLNSLGQFAQSQQNALGQDYLRGNWMQAELGSMGALGGLQNAYAQGQTPYQGQNFMQGINSGLLSNFDPNQAAMDYTTLLRQQAQPQEQQAASSMMTNLFGQGRLGTTGGATQFGQLQQAQQQADISRQVAGQQFGLQQQLMAQQGYDQARANQQGLMLNNFGANQQGQMNQFNMDQGMFGRALDLYTNSASATQDRFGRAMQLFGAENAMGQQYLQNFQNFLGSQQSQQQQLMDLSRIGASVGQSQTAAGAQAAAIRNNGTQDAIAGFMGAFNQWNANRNKQAENG